MSSRQDRRLAVGVVAALMVLLVGVGLLAAFVPADGHFLGVLNLWGPSSGLTSREQFRFDPTGGELRDEHLYVGTLQLVRKGVPYYKAALTVFNYDPGRWNVKSPLTFRQPLPTYIWLVLGDGAVIGVVWSVLAALSLLAAYFAAEKFVPPLAALLAPLGLAAVYGITVWHPVRLLWAEVWAAPFAVVAGACAALVLWDTRAEGGRRAWLFATVGALSALVAMACRELALAPVLIMALALLLAPAVRRRHLWIPWAAAVLLWAGQYAWHAQQVIALTASEPAVEAPTALRDYLFVGPGALTAGIRWASSEIYLLPFVVLLCLMAAVSAFTVRSAALRVLVGGLTLGMLGLMMLVGPPVKTYDGYLNGYWGYLFVPIVIAWAPLALRLIPGMRPNRSDDDGAGDWFEAAAGSGNPPPVGIDG